MIRTLEQHLAAWAERELESLGAQSGLLGAVRAVPGALALPPDQPLAEGEVAVLVSLSSVAPRPENQDLGPAPVTRDATLGFTAAGVMRVMARNVPYVTASSTVAVAPAAATIHPVDVAAMTLLASLRERSVPGGSGAGGGAPELGARPSGTASVTGAGRRAGLSWTGFMPGAGTVSDTADGLHRVWEVAVSADCTYRLSPAPLEGGRILRLEAQHETESGSLVQTHQFTVYGPAEQLPLDWFSGLSQAVLAELASRDLTTLGAVGRLGPAGAAAMAAGLAAASADERGLLEDLAAVAELRQAAAELPSLLSLKPEPLALSARALLAPTAPEAALLAELITSLGLSNRIATTAVPIAFALRPEQRERVTVGTLLTVGR
jgi:hypothetical protein